MLLYRPIGEAELRLIAATNFRAFPPRLSHQLNRHLQGEIRVTEAFVGPAFKGTLDPATRLPIDLARG
jgi:hypothetical protein